MASGPRQSGSVDPDDLGRREFTKSRKGWDPVEVRAHLLTMAGEIKRLQGLEFEHEARIVGLEADLERHSNLDEGVLTQMLGEETARVLEAARKASAEIKAKAEERAAKVVGDAELQGAAITRDAEELRLAASREADELVAEARSRSDELLSDARRAADELRSNAEIDAATTRERADRVLADRTAEAESEAERVRGAAQATRDDADSYSARIRADADADATRRGEEAAAISESEIEEREQGRRMVQEAKDARERMLRDLAERRRTARQQLEALRAGRERLLEAFGTARAAFDDATDELTDALPAARAAADAAAKEVDDDLDAAVAEIEAELEIDHDPAADTSEEGPDNTGGDDVFTSIDDEPFVPGGEPESVVARADEVPPGSVVDGAEDPTASDGADAEPNGGAHLRLVASSDVTTASDDDGDERDDDDLDDDEEGSGSVEAIFARLRANQPEDADEPDGTELEDDAVVIELQSELTEASIEAEVSVLDRRDDLLEGIERQAARKLKRVLSDQENALLDRLQRGRKAKLNSEVLEDEAASREALWTAVADTLGEAAAAGGVFYVDDDHGSPVDESAEVADLRGAFDEWVAVPLRERLERTIAETDDRAEAPDRLHAAYREWKNDRIPDLAGDLVSAAFNRGILGSTVEGAVHGWVVDHGGLPSPDCDDNHLAGHVLVGEEFPTGHLAPPAQLGCRCLLVTVRG